MTRRIPALTALAIALSMFVGPAACMRRARVESQQAAAGPDYYAPAPTTVLFPQAQQPELVRAAVIRAMSDRGYVAESEQPGVIIARYQREAEQHIPCEQFDGIRHGRPDKSMLARGTTDGQLFAVELERCREVRQWDCLDTRHRFSVGTRVRTLAHHPPGHRHRKGDKEAFRRLHAGG